MQKAKKIAEELRSRFTPATEQEIVNAIREYLQTILLQSIYQSKWGAALSFLGGTALRICYDLKRYSEDLDFTLDDKKKPYQFSLLIDHLKKEMTLRGFEVSISFREDKIVQKGFISFAGLEGPLAFRSFRKGQKIHIKLEVDIQPVPLKEGDRESFFVNRFQEIFPILKHTLPTLFAGKILAVLCRSHFCGRDYYDLIWYLTRKTELNLDYVNRGMKKTTFRDERGLLDAVGKKVKEVTPSLILKDIGPFLEDPQESKWIERYHELFEQLQKSRLGQHVPSMTS